MVAAGWRISLVTLGNSSGSHLCRAPSGKVGLLEGVEWSPLSASLGAQDLLLGALHFLQSP